MSGGDSAVSARILVWTVRQEVYVYLLCIDSRQVAAAMQPVCKCPCAVWDPCLSWALSWAALSCTGWRQLTFAHVIYLPNIPARHDLVCIKF